MTSVVVALRHASRSLLRAPWFALGAIATFAMGIGFNVAVFASLDRLLFRRLPYPDPDRLFLMQQTDVQTGQRISSLPARYVAEARAGLGAIEDLAVLGDSTGYFETASGDGPEVRVAFATRRMLDISGVRPVLGRGFVEDDDRLDRKVVMLTHEAWTARFGGRPDAVGRRLWWRDTSLEVIGILPRGYIPPGAHIDPAMAGLALMPMPGISGSTAGLTMPPTIRLRPDVSREAAQAALDALIGGLEPATASTAGPARTTRLIPIREAMFGLYYQYLWLVIGGAALVLCLACANLGSLFLVRGRSRLRDAAVQLSLGASPGRLVGESLAEGIIVCLAGAAAALLMLRWSGRALEATLPPLVGRFSAGVDGRVLIFALAIAGLASLAASLLPAFLLARRGNAWWVMQGASNPLGNRSRWRGRWLLTFESAIGVLLVAAAAVTAQNATGLAGVTLGFEPRDLHLVLVRSSAGAPADRFEDLQQALSLVRSQPGVVSAAGAPMMPVLATGIAPFAPAGPPCCRWQITGDYMTTIGVPILAGRAISDDDVHSRATVAVLSESGLRQVWPGLPAAAAIGRTVSFEGDPAREVVGIAGDTRRGYDADVLPAMYVPVTDDKFGGMLIVARTRPGTASLVGSLRTRIETSGRRALLYIRPMAPMYERVLQAPRFRAALFGAFGAVALLIVMVGLYALISFDVADRRREIGVRMALGASRRAVVRLVLTDSGKPVVAGLAIGLSVAVWAAHFLEPFLYRVDPRDPRTLALAALALLVTGLLAAWTPAWRASRVDPAIVLKT